MSTSMGSTGVTFPDSTTQTTAFTGGGVTSAVAGNGVAVSASTGAVTFSASAPSSNSIGSYCFGYITSYNAIFTFGSNYAAGTGNGQIQLNISSSSFPTGSISGTWKWMGIGGGLTSGGTTDNASGIAVRVA